MELNIVGRHMEVAQMYERHAREKFGKLDKYFSGIQHADIVLDRDGHGQNPAFTVEASIVLGHGAKLVAKAQDSDMMKAIDMTESRLEKQIRRFHRKLKSHRERGHGAPGPAVVPASEEATYEQVVREMLEEGEE